MNILFSPIGQRDPINNNHDGSMLHICRHYKPDIVYLYLSKTMCDLHKKDNRYQIAIIDLSKQLKKKIDIRIIFREDLEDVQEYDFFYNDFYKELSRIHSDMDKDDILYVNMASGTPAMKSALLIIANFVDYNIIPIQVMSPNHSAPKDFIENYNIDRLIQLNVDNLEEAENRCKEVKSLNLLYIIKVDMIKKLLYENDYKGAQIIAREIEEQLSEDIKEYLEKKLIEHNNTSK